MGADNNDGVCETSWITLVRCTIKKAFIEDTKLVELKCQNNENIDKVKEITNIDKTFWNRKYYMYLILHIFSLKVLAFQLFLLMQNA